MAVVGFPGQEVEHIGEAENPEVLQTCTFCLETTHERGFRAAVGEPDETLATLLSIDKKLSIARRVLFAELDFAGQQIAPISVFQPSLMGFTLRTREAALVAFVIAAGPYHE